MKGRYGPSVVATSARVRDVASNIIRLTGLFLIIPWTSRVSALRVVSLLPARMSLTALAADPEGTDLLESALNAVVRDGIHHIFGSLPYP